MKNQFLESAEVAFDKLVQDHKLAENNELGLLTIASVTEEDGIRTNVLGAISDKKIFYALKSLVDDNPTVLDMMKEIVVESMFKKS